ncbi:MAG: DUF2867 domain-containing protein [Noviherbaspirillum sp.]
MGGAGVLDGILARDAAQVILGEPPRLARVLMSVRNCIVSLFGLKTPVPADHAEARANQIGIFPVLSETAEEIVLGVDDKHLDFRICVSVQRGPQDAHISVATLVHIHNLFGRLYMFVVLPFHRLLSRHMLLAALKKIANGHVGGRRATALE